jgi:hypothetical protein
MKSNELKFLLGLHTGINKGCEVLGVDRSAFMATLTRFIETVSLGIEMGLKMKGKPTPLITKVAKGTVAKKGKTTFSDRMVQIMGSATMTSEEIAAAVLKRGDAPKSENLRAYISTTLSASKTNGKKTFTAAKRGHYFVTATKKKNAKGAAPKASKASKTKGKSADLHRADKVRTSINAVLAKGGVMGLGEITKAAKASLIGLNDPSKTVWTIISKSPDIEKVKPGFYRLKGKKKAVTNGKTKSQATPVLTTLN